MRGMFVAAIAACVVALGALAAPKEDEPKKAETKAVEPEKLKIVLRDGSHLTGEAAEGQVVQIETRFGSLKIPLTDVRRLTLDPEGVTDTLRTQHMLLAGKVATAGYRIKTEYLGTVTLDREAVKELRCVSRAGGLAGTWEGMAVDKPGHGGSRDGMTLKISGGDAPGLCRILATGQFARGGRQRVAKVEIRDGKIAFEFHARDGDVFVVLEFDPEHPDEMEGEATPAGAEGAPRNITLTRVRRDDD